MFRFTLLAALGLAMSLAAGSPAPAAKAAKKKTARLKGVIEAVEPARENTGATITVKVRQGKSKGQPAAEPVLKKFQLTRDTKIDKVSGKKADKEFKPAAFSDLQKGTRVRLRPKVGSEDVLQAVEIRAGKKAKRSKQAAR
jgi:hypothetical protein